MNYVTETTLPPRLSTKSTWDCQGTCCIEEHLHERPTEKILVFSLQLGCMLERNSLIGLLKNPRAGNKLI